MPEEEKVSTGSAIGARREQVKSFDRPERLGDVNIAQEVAAIRETADLFKVYVPQWLIVFTSPAAGTEGQSEAEAFFAKKYAERVRDEDVRYEPASKTLPEEFPQRLLLRLPNVCGEFKTRELANAFVAERGYTDAKIVARNSRDDYAIREYGQKKLARS